MRKRSKREEREEDNMLEREWEEDRILRCLRGGEGRRMREREEDMSVDGFVCYQVSILSPLHQSSGQSLLLITGLESNYSPIIPKVYVRLYNCMEKFAYNCI